MPKPIPYKFRLVYFFVFVVAFLIGFPVLIFYSAGYTIDETFGLSVRGGIYVFTPEPDTSVFVGNELKSRSSFFQKEILVNRLKPGQYLVLAANDDFWPWAKLVEVERGEVEALFPLFVPKVIETTEIESTDSDYEEIVELFEKPIIATRTAINSKGSLGKTTATATGATTATTTPEMLTRKRVGIWIDENKIFAEWQGSNAAAPKYFCHETLASGDPKEIAIVRCTDPVLVFDSSIPVRFFDFFPLRDDAIILALDNGVYAVEIDRREYQNFYPLYRGQAPDFRIENDQVYIRDNDYLAVLDLQL